MNPVLQVFLSSNSAGPPTSTEMNVGIKRHYNRACFRCELAVGFWDALIHTDGARHPSAVNGFVRNMAENCGIHLAQAVKFCKRTTKMVTRDLHSVRHSAPPSDRSGIRELARAAYGHARIFSYKPLQTFEGFVKVPHRSRRDTVRMNRPPIQESIVVLFIAVDFVRDQAPIVSRVPVPLFNKRKILTPVHNHFAFPSRKGPVINDEAVRNTSAQRDLLRIEKTDKCMVPRPQFDGGINRSAGASVITDHAGTTAINCLYVRRSLSTILTYIIPLTFERTDHRVPASTDRSKECCPCS